MSWFGALKSLAGLSVQRSLPTRWRPRRCASLQTQVREDLLDHRLLQDGRDDLQLAAAVLAVLNIQRNDALGQPVPPQPYRPAAAHSSPRPSLPHGPAPCARCSRSRRLWVLVAASGTSNAAFNSAVTIADRSAPAPGANWIASVLMLSGLFLASNLAPRFSAGRRSRAAALAAFERRPWQRFTAAAAACAPARRDTSAPRRGPCARQSGAQNRAAVRAPGHAHRHARRPAPTAASGRRCAA